MRVIVKTHDGEERVTEVESYDPVQIANDMNSVDKMVIVVGDILVHKTNVSKIYPESSIVDQSS
jgi:hypothetical protein